MGTIEKAIKLGVTVYTNGYIVRCNADSTSFGRKEQSDKMISSWSERYEYRSEVSENDHKWLTLGGGRIAFKYKGLVFQGDVKAQLEKLVVELEKETAEKVASEAKKAAELKVEIKEKLARENEEANLGIRFITGLFEYEVRTGNFTNKKVKEVNVNGKKFTDTKIAAEYAEKNNVEYVNVVFND